MRDEQLQKDAKVKAAKRLLQSPKVKQERLHKDAMWKATKRLQESPQERKERLIIIIIIIIIITTVEPQPVYNGHPWELGPTKVLRQVLLYYFFPLFLLLCLIKDFHTNRTSLLNSKRTRGMCSIYYALLLLNE